MSASTQRRLVTKARYLSVMGWKLTLNMLATVIMAAGVVSVVNFVCWIAIAHVSRIDMVRVWICCNLLSAGILLLFVLGGLMYRKSNLIEPVGVLSERNAHLLPLQETLVRESCVPSVDESTELLRVSQDTLDSSIKELLHVPSAGPTQLDDEQAVRH